jgi:putative SOS response-associated peptidase YedK
LRDKQLFAFVGFWGRWTRESQETCAILTTGAKELVRPLPVRMPVVLPLAFHDDWLAPHADSARWLQSALRPNSAQEMEAVPIST